jgi:hypothetical protein
MAQTTPNLQLTVWNNLTDPYNSEQLANNFIKLDQHDHSPGKGAPIDGSSIKDASITNAKLAANSVTTGTIAAGAVQTADLEDSTSTITGVTTNKIADSAVTTVKIADLNVTSSKLEAAITNQLSLDTNTAKKKRYKYISTSEAVSGTTTAVATTPDRISGLVVAAPGNSGFGIIHFAYLAQWRRSSTTNSGAVAEVWLDDGSSDRQAYVLTPSGGTNYTGPCRTAIPVSSVSGAQVADWRPLHTINGGFVLGNSNSTSNNGIVSIGTINGTADIGVGANGLWGNGNLNYMTLNSSWLYTTNYPAFTSSEVPFMMPPAIQILVPAGTYNIEVRFAKGSTGDDMTVKQRHMWAWTESFTAES